MNDQDRFEAWFSGLVDGEGMFGLYRTSSNSFLFLFKLSVRNDDAEMLKLVQERLGIGRFVSNVKNGDANPAAHFIVNRLSQLHAVLIPILRRHPLRSKKQRDFELFTSAVELALANFRKPLDRSESGALADFSRRLRAVKRFAA